MVVLAVIVCSLAFYINLSNPKTQINLASIIKSSTTKQTSTIVAEGQPVQWTIFVKRSDITKNQNLLKLPKQATNIKIHTTTTKQATALLKQPKQQLLSLAQRQQLAIQNSNNKNANLITKAAQFLFADLTDAVTSVVESITGNTTETTDQNITQTPDATIVDLTDQAPVTTEEAITDTESIPESIPELIPSETPTTSLTETTSSSDTAVTVPAFGAEDTTQNQTDDVVQVDYTTPAPNIIEQTTDTGKLVTISTTSEDPTVPMVDVVASTKIPEIYKVGQEDKIHIKWKNNGDQDVFFNAYDTDNNGKLDYVEWTVPHLSDQIFEIIFISKAFQLDQDKNIVADIYEQVQTQDNVWVSIENNQYVRVTFDQVLNSENDITVYAKPTDLSFPAQIEVYPVYTDADGNVTEGSKLEIVSDGTNPDFSNIDHDGKYRILLQNIQTPTDVFDLKIIGGSLDIDYIVDPTVSVTVTSPSGEVGTSVPFAASTNGASLIPNLDSGLVSWWRMDDIDGSGNPTDYMGANNGTKQGNAAQTASGKFGKGFAFDGATTSYISVPSSVSLNTVNDGNATFNFWYKRATTSGVMTAMSFYYDGNSTPRIDLRADNNIYWRGLITGSSSGVICSAAQTTDTSWHMVSLVSLNDANNTTKIYIDGSLSSTCTTLPKSFASMPDGFRVSLGVDDEGTNKFQAMNGIIDESMIFKSALTDDEITGLYNATAISHTSTLATGAHTYTVYGEDTTGNVGSATRNFTVGAGGTPADAYWVGGAGGTYNWSDAANHWASTSNGTPDAANLPGPTTNVYFDANSGTGTVTLDSDVTIGSFAHSETGLTLAIGTKDFQVAGASSVTNGTVTIGVSANIGWTTTNMTIGTGGTVTCSGNSIITASGNWNSSAGTFTKGTSTVNLIGTGNLTTIISASTFYNLSLAYKISGTRYTTTMLSAVRLANILTLNGGTLAGSALIGLETTATTPLVSTDADSAVTATAIEYRISNAANSNKTFYVGANADLTGTRINLDVGSSNTNITFALNRNLACIGIWMESTGIGTIFTTRDAVTSTDYNLTLTDRFTMSRWNVYNNTQSKSVYFNSSIISIGTLLGASRMYNTNVTDYIYG